MAVQFTPWVPPLLLAFLLTFALGGYGLRSYRRHPQETHLLAFGVFVLGMSGWIGLTVGQQLTPAHDLKLLFVNMASAIFVLVTVYGVLWFALVYTGNPRWVNRWTGGVVAAHVLGSVIVLSLFPNLLYETWVVTEPGTTLLGVTFEPYVVLKRDLKPGFVFVQVHAYAVLLTAGFVIGRFLFRYRENLYRGQAAAILLGMLVPISLNAMLFTGLVAPEYNLTELSFAFTGSALAFGVFRYRMFDLVPVARDTVIEDMREGFVVCNERDVVLDANPAADEMLGVGAGSLTGRELTEVLPGIESLLGAPSPGGSGELRLGVDGRDLSLAVSLSPLGSDGGEDGRLVTFRDVTERHRYERELEEEREKYSTLVEQSHDGVAIIQDGVLVFVNRRVEAMLGRDQADILGTSFQRFVSPEDRETVVERHERRLRGEDIPGRYDIALTTPGGDRRVVDLQATDIQYEGAPAVLVTLNDITERKAYERSLEEQNRKLELLNRLVRHDIRNDMNVVIGYAELLDAELGTETDEETLVQWLEGLQTRSEHVVELTDVVRDLMETMQADGEHRRPVSLRTVLDAELESLRASAEDAVVRAPTPVPDVEVLADEMLGSIFQNLLTNAVEHTPSATPEVDVAVEVAEDAVTVRVADHGPGIPDRQKAEIFGKGEKGIESSGTGIGLYLVHTLVTSYGGEVRVEDNDPRGSAFVVELQRVT